MACGENEFDTPALNIANMIAIHAHTLTHMHTLKTMSLTFQLSFQLLVFPLAGILDMAFCILSTSPGPTRL